LSACLITDASIVTGDGMTKPFMGDLLIEADRIAELGQVSRTARQTADRVVAAEGRTLAPGFIDTHNHGALGGTKPGFSGLPLACELALSGGVTKRICGVDGLSPAPVAQEQRRDYAAQIQPLDGGIDGDWPWSSVAEFWRWHRGRSATDMGLYLGHGAVRRVVMDNVARAANDGEIQAMCEVVRREALLTLGFSTGLIYSPAVYCDQHEIAALVRAFNEVKPGALFPHLRSESDGIIDSLREVIEAAADGGGAYCNEHSKIAGARNYEKISALEDMLADAAAGMATMENMYPYPAGSTTGDALFPPEVRAGSRETFLGRLREPNVRRALYERMRHDTTTWDNFIDFCGGLDGVQVAGVLEGVGEEALGRRLGDIARAAGARDMESRPAFEAVFDFFVANKGEVAIITHFGSEVTVERLFRRPSMAICTDGLMPGPGQKPHPRAIGAFPKALRMAREMGIPLEQIIFRLSTLACRFLGLEDPVLRPGADASLVLFDWSKVREQNDYDDPLAPPDGISAVWVHGELLQEDGTFRVPGRLPGRALLSANPT
jgi:N-acyl-D-aspartate/D-glutamate deacylase